MKVTPNFYFLGIILGIIFTWLTKAIRVVNTVRKVFETLVRLFKFVCVQLVPHLDLISLHITFLNAIMVTSWIFRCIFQLQKYHFFSHFSNHEGYLNVKYVSNEKYGHN